MLGGILSATKHLIKLPPIKDLRGITEFEYLLVPSLSQRLRQACDRNYSSLKTLTCMFLIKPTPMMLSETKSTLKLHVYRDV